MEKAHNYLDRQWQGKYCVQCSIVIASVPYISMGSARPRSIKCAHRWTIWDTILNVLTRWSRRFTGNMQIFHHFIGVVTTEWATSRAGFQKFQNPLFLIFYQIECWTNTKLCKGFSAEMQSTARHTHTLSGPQCNCIVKFYEILLRISLDFVRTSYSLVVVDFAIFRSHTTIKQINSNLFIFNRPIRLHLVNFVLFRILVCVCAWVCNGQSISNRCAHVHR